MQRLRPGTPPKITRELYEKVKRYNRLQFAGFCEELYSNGYTDGRDNTPNITYEKLYTTLAGAEGIGPVTLKKVLDVVRDKFGGETEGGQ